MIAGSDCEASNAIVNQLMLEESAPHADLVPTFLDVGVPGQRITEYLCWDPDNEADIDTFASMLSSEAGYSGKQHALITQKLASDLRQQIQAYQHAKKHLFCKDFESKPCLELIKLDFRVGAIHVRDQFVWDLANDKASPERFAYAFCNDVSLETEVACRMAWHIRDQVYALRKLGRSTGSIPPISSKEKEENLHVIPTENGEEIKLRALYDSDVVRPRSEWAEYTPSVLYLPDYMVQELDAEEEEMRRMKDVEDHARQTKS